ncbi:MULTISPECIES: VanZ family protein [unclassified Knoellia]|uniref:VanZ family protein n=1 Tax=Knoellia altitudinis TaxID=3404795 RepID=UPI0036138601
MTSSRRLLAALFVVYLVLLTWVVMWKLEVPSVGGGFRNVKLTPFVSSNGDGASQPREVWANLLLFVPFGVYLSLLGPQSSRLRVMLAAAATSMTFEVAQYVLAVGRTDITDVIVNTAGAVVGMTCGLMARHGLGARTHRIVARASAVATVLALAGCAIFAGTPLRHGPPDVVCDSHGSCRTGADLVR